MNQRQKSLFGYYGYRVRVKTTNHSLGSDQSEPIGSTDPERLELAMQG